MNIFTAIFRHKYKPNYVHAKKLFIFDIILLSGIIFLATTTIIWFNFKPNLSEKIDLGIKLSLNRLESGDYLKFTVVYKNNSDRTITDPKLSFSLPENFRLNKVEVESGYTESGNTISLPNIHKNEKGEVTIDGWYLHTPNLETKLDIKLSYGEDGKPIRESKLARAVVISRGSKLKTSIEVADKVINHSRTPITISLENNSEITFLNVKIALDKLPAMEILDPTTDIGRVVNGIWEIDELKPKAVAKLNASLVPSTAPEVTEVNLNITPTLQLNKNTVDQERETKILQVLEPLLSSEIIWETGESVAKPGQTIPAKIILKNLGKTDLQNLNILISLPSAIVNTAKFIELNQGSLSDNIFVVNSTHNARLTKLPVGKTVNINIVVPIKDEIKGITNPTLELSPRTSASVVGVANSSSVSLTNSSKLIIGTSVFLKSQLMYYTNEGDQLGRGSLPPTVGKETKYWAIFTIQNTSSAIQKAIFQAKLSGLSNWTGKTSVSTGQDVTYDKSTNSVVWKADNLLPYEEVGVYFELGFIPTESQRNTTQNLVESASFEGFDSYSGQVIQQYSGSLNTGLAGDLRAKQKGVVIK